MRNKNIHIHTDLNSAEQKSANEKILNQNGISIWLTGLSGSGKTTLAKCLKQVLSEVGKVCTNIDGDNIRNGINKDLDFSESGRIENIRRVAEINKLFNQSGIISISSFISPTSEIREMAKQIIGEEIFIEIHVSTSLAECEKRDVNGLYAKARAGKIRNFTGIDAPFEIPKSPNFIIDTIDKTPRECIETILPELLKLLNR